MKSINMMIDAPRHEVLSMLSDNERVNDKVVFDERNGRPFMKVKEKGSRIIITCEMIGRATRDNGFGYLVGTYFSGNLTERDGVTYLKGRIITAPIYHSIMLVLLAVIIAQCIYMRAISVLPFLFIPIELVMFYGEFKKQGYIKRYIQRAFRRVYSDKRR